MTCIVEKNEKISLMSKIVEVSMTIFIIFLKMEFISYFFSCDKKKHDQKVLKEGILF